MTRYFANNTFLIHIITFLRSHTTWHFTTRTNLSLVKWSDILRLTDLDRQSWGSSGLLSIRFFFFRRNYDSKQVSYFRGPVRSEKLSLRLMEMDNGQFSPGLIDILVKMIKNHSQGTTTITITTLRNYIIFSSWWTIKSLKVADDKKGHTFKNRSLWSFGVDDKTYKAVGIVVILKCEY